jgi:hypothetical protein
MGDAEVAIGDIQDTVASRMHGKTRVPHEQGKQHGKTQVSGGNSH